MYSTLIVARLEPDSIEDVTGVFTEFDQTELPHLMGTRRRQLFTYHGLYFHLQDFDRDEGGEAIARARNHPRFVQVSDDLKPYITPYDPQTWRSPADAMARRFYLWPPAS